VDREALNQFSKDQLIALLLAQGARIAELERRLLEPKASASDKDYRDTYERSSRLPAHGWNSGSDIWQQAQTP
jgi:hypothetical protein